MKQVATCRHEGRMRHSVKSSARQHRAGHEWHGMSETILPGLERRLKAALLGEVAFDAFTRGRYATDASHYQVMPIGVVAPRSIKEAQHALALAREEGV